MLELGSVTGISGHDQHAADYMWLGLGKLARGSAYVPW